jgi:acetyltransferase-like isoleucine patch superfamily enzyme
VIRALLARLRKRVIVRRCRQAAVIGTWFDVRPGAAISNEAGREAVVLGDHVYLGGHLATSPKGSIRIGSYTWIGPEALLASAAEIVVGQYVGIATGVQIIDNNNHPTEPEARKEHRIRIAPGGPGYPSAFAAWDLSDKAPIIIEDNVWIGTGAFIGKGVRIGEGAIVARQAVVTHDVPPYAVAAGNPARIVKKLR